jgi:hypothetical protein
VFFTAVARLTNANTLGDRLLKANNTTCSMKSNGVARIRLTRCVNSAEFVEGFSPDCAAVAEFVGRMESA